MNEARPQHWTTPELTVHGSVEELTQATKVTGFADVPFPEDAPDLTGS